MTMSAAAYDNVARLKMTGGARLPSHFINPPPPPAAQSRARAKQRKWRVLLAIGLLLPALAAIIGIVAWAISIEVANSDEGGGNGINGIGGLSSLAQRRSDQQRAQALQFRRDEAVALATMAAARRATRPSSGQESNAAEQSTQQKRRMAATLSQAVATNENQPREAGGSSVISIEPKAKRPAVLVANGNELSAANGGDQAQHQQQVARTTSKQQARRMAAPNQQQQSMKAAKTNSESSLILTNLDQIEALSGSAAGAPQPKQSDDDVKESASDEQEPPLQPHSSSPLQEDPIPSTRTRSSEFQQWNSGQVVSQSGESDKDENSSGEKLGDEATQPPAKWHQKQHDAATPQHRPNGRDGTQSRQDTADSGASEPIEQQIEDVAAADKVESDAPKAADSAAFGNNGGGASEEPAVTTMGASVAANAEEEQQQQAAAGSKGGKSAWDANQPRRQHKSRWLNYDKQNRRPINASGSPAPSPALLSNRRQVPMQDSVGSNAGATKKALAPVKQYNGKTQMVADRRQAASASLRNIQGSKYTLVDKSPQSQNDDSDNTGHSSASSSAAATSDTTQGAEQTPQSATNENADSTETAAAAGEARLSAATNLDGDQQQQQQPIKREKTKKVEAITSGGRNQKLGHQTAENGATSADEDDDAISFEAIASAISSTLSQTGGANNQALPPVDEQQQQRSLLPAPIEQNSDSVQQSRAGDDSDQIEAVAAVAPAAAEDSSQSEAPEANQQEKRQKRRRTTGEHVAEVIDHIVLRHKQQHQQQQQQRQRSYEFDSELDNLPLGDVDGDFGRASGHHHHHQGPQIVVVAPVGGGGANMKARSLTRTDSALPPTNKQFLSSKSSIKTSVSKKRDEQIVSTAASVSQLKKKHNDAIKRSTAATGGGAIKQLVGARLLGTDPVPSNEQGGQKSSSGADAAEAIKYSERVEVIEDDDSSALLMRASSNRKPVASEQMIGSGGEAEEEDSLLSSVHISSHSGQSRSRSPRHELSASRTLERYAPLPPENRQQQAVYHQQQQQQQQPQQAKLYSAEQLIREHVLRSKSKPNKAPTVSRAAASGPALMVVAGDRPADLSSAASSTGNGPLKVAPSASPQQQSLSSTTSATISTTTTTAPSSTTQASPSTQANGAPSTTEAAPASAGAGTGDQQRVTAAEMAGQQYSSGIQAVRVPMFVQQQQQQQPFQASFQQIQMPVNFAMQRHLLQGRQYGRQESETYQPMESQQQLTQVRGPATHAAQQQQQQQQETAQYERGQQEARNDNYQPQGAGQMLPVFADQEFNVPAHMAESVIKDLQQSQSSVAGVLNGQPTMFQAYGQVPQMNHNLHQTFHHLNQLPSSPPTFHSMVNNHHHQQRQQPLYVAASQQQPAGLWNEAYASQVMARRLEAAANRHHYQQQQQQQFVNGAGRQVLANRVSGEQSSEKAAAAPAPAVGSSLINSVKALGPRKLVQPMAQMALKHLFSSLGEQAAAQQAQADALESQQRSSSQMAAAAAAAAAASAANIKSPSQQQQLAPSSQDNQIGTAVQAAGSAPIASAVLPPPGVNGQNVAAAATDSMQVAGSSGRSMRSLPIGAQLHQQQIAINDQEVQESYGQMPTYHMGGEGGGYPPAYHPAPPAYENDKKSKGMTFHFGGGPIGGGTQLITSPMGIFKHLMIPLLPNPRVNLNGKVVFGVVLEKTTAFGDPPKKKHKFWGR